MNLLITIVAVAVLATGCTSKSRARAEAQQAWLAGQNAALQQQAAQAQPGGITVVGPVQHSNVPWVVGLTLTQAIATATYLSPDAPKQIIITRQGEDGAVDPQALVNGVQIPLEPGDVITLK
jgi:hypothetical protein